MPKENDEVELTFMKMQGFKCNNFGKDITLCRYGTCAPIPCCIFCDRKEECAANQTWENNVEGPCLRGFSYCWKYFKWREDYRE